MSTSTVRPGDYRDITSHWTDLGKGIEELLRLGRSLAVLQKDNDDSSEAIKVCERFDLEYTVKNLQQDAEEYKRLYGHRLPDGVSNTIMAAQIAAVRGMKLPANLEEISKQMRPYLLEIKAIESWSPDPEWQSQEMLGKATYEETIHVAWGNLRVGLSVLRSLPDSGERIEESHISIDEVVSALISLHQIDNGGEAYSVGGCKGQPSQLDQDWRRTLTHLQAVTATHNKIEFRLDAPPVAEIQTADELARFVDSIRPIFERIQDASPWLRRCDLTDPTSVRALCAVDGYPTRYTVSRSLQQLLTLQDIDSKNANLIYGDISVGKDAFVGVQEAMAIMKRTRDRTSLWRLHNEINDWVPDPSRRGTPGMRSTFVPPNSDDWINFDEGTNKRTEADCLYLMKLYPQLVPRCRLRIMAISNGY